MGIDLPAMQDRLTRLIPGPVIHVRAAAQKPDERNQGEGDRGRDKQTAQEKPRWAEPPIALPGQPVERSHRRLCVSASSMHRQLRLCADLVPVGALFVGMGDLKNARLVERFSEELQPNRQFLPAL